MNNRTLFVLILVTYLTLGLLGSATGRSHGLKYHHNHHHHSHLHNSYHNRDHHPQSTDLENQESRIYPSKHSKSATSWRPSDEDFEDDEEDDGRHAYLMTKETRKTSREKTEDQTLTQAFEKHMKPDAINLHDVYAYQLPSDLWFVVRYSKNDDGQVEKYMNVVDSFTNYLEKLDKHVRSVSVNVKGVETVFNLTPKRKPD